MVAMADSKTLGQYQDDMGLDLVLLCGSIGVKKGEESRDEKGIDRI
jgi:hypothetical protein